MILAQVQELKGPVESHILTQSVSIHSPLTFINASFWLFHKLANKDHSGSRAITTDVILGNSCPCNHDCSRVLYLLQPLMKYQVIKHY